MLVQIAKEPIKTKDAALTCDISFAGTYFVHVPKSHGIHYSKKITEQQKQILWQMLDKIMPMLFGDLAVFLDRYGLIVRTNAVLAEETILFQELHDLFHKASKVLQTADKRTVYSCIYREADLFEQAIRNQYDLDDTEIITDQAKIAAKIQESMGLTIRLYEDKQLSLFALYGLKGQIENALSRRVWLKSGGYLIIDPTEALTVIDVNTGKAPGKKKEREAFYFQTNKEAAIETARQLRVRNISGMILIDFINMESKADQETLLTLFKEQLRKDPIQTVFVRSDKAWSYRDYPQENSGLSGRKTWAQQKGNSIMKLLSLKKVHDGRYLKNYELTYENKAGRNKVYEIVSRKELHDTADLGRSTSGVSIIAFQGDKLLLLKEFRMGINKSVYNLCAGMLNEGESMEDCIRRELYEETGLSVKKIVQILPPSYSAVAISDVKTNIAIVEAEGAITGGHTSANEQIQAAFYTKTQLREMLQTEEFSSRSQLAAYFFVNNVNFKGKLQ